MVSASVVPDAESVVLSIEIVDESEDSLSLTVDVISFDVVVSKVEEPSVVDVADVVAAADVGESVVVVIVVEEPSVVDVAEVVAAADVEDSVTVVIVLTESEDVDDSVEYVVASDSVTVVVLEFKLSSTVQVDNCILDKEEAHAASFAELQT